MTPNRNTLEIIGLFCVVAFSGAACQQELPVAGINGQHSSAEPGTSGSDSLALFQKAQVGSAQDRAAEEDPPVIFGPPPPEPREAFIRVAVSPIDADNLVEEACKNWLVDWVNIYGLGPWDEGRVRGYRPEKVPKGQRPRVYIREPSFIKSLHDTIVAHCNIETSCYCFAEAPGRLEFRGSGLETFQHCINAQARCSVGNPGMESQGALIDDLISGGSKRLFRTVLKNLGKKTVEEIFKEATEDFRKELKQRASELSDDAGITERKEDKKTRNIKSAVGSGEDL